MESSRNLPTSLAACLRNAVRNLREVQLWQHKDMKEDMRVAVDSVEQVAEELEGLQLVPAPTPQDESR